jgi:hypothetical protein
LDNRPRWFVLSSSLLAVFALSFFGNYYHRWLLGIGAAVAIVAATNLLYGFVRLRALKPARPKKDQQAVIVLLPPPHREPSDEPAEDLWTLETLLSDVIEREGLGEYDGNDIGESGAILYMYGSSAETLFRGVEATLRSSSLCKNARVQLRAGPPGSPHREIQL